MNLPSVTNAPRTLVLGGVSYRARALTLGQIGEVLAWLEGRLPPGSERDGPTLFSGESSRIALATTEGLAVLLHLSLLSCHPSLTRDDAKALAAAMDENDEIRLLAIAFRRHPCPPAENDRPAKDLAEVNWGEIFADLTGHRADAYEGAASLSLDQFDNFVGRGVSQKDTMSPAEVQAMWEAAKPAGNPAEEDARV
jgi:hypothetical protein